MGYYEITTKRVVGRKLVDQIVRVPNGIDEPTWNENDLAVALAEVRRLRAGIEAVCSWINQDTAIHEALAALIDPAEDIYSEF